MARRPAASPRAGEQRKHNKRSRQVHPLPVHLRLEDAWSYWKGSKRHLVERGRIGRNGGKVCQAMPPEALRNTVVIELRSYDFRPANVCVGCFIEYLARDAVRKAGANPVRSPRLPSTDRPQTDGIIATEFGEIVARRVDVIVNEETPR